MRNPETLKNPNLQRHVDSRIKALHRHERVRLAGDRDREEGNFDGARTDYESAVEMATRHSGGVFRVLTNSIVRGWVEREDISQKEADQFLRECDLGYAGETRVGVVASTSRAKVARSDSERNEWIRDGMGLAERHFNWWETITEHHRTIDRRPVLWLVNLDHDKASAAETAGDFETAFLILGKAFERVLGVLGEDSSHELRLAAMSDGGVVRVRQAQLMEKTGYPEPFVLRIFQEGVEMVQEADWQTGNLERISVIESWYTQYLWRKKNFRELIKTLPTWTRLIAKHANTRQKLLGQVGRVFRS